MLVCDIENTKGLLCSKSPNVYLEPKWLQCPDVAVGLTSVGLPMKAGIEA